MFKLTVPAAHFLRSKWVNLCLYSCFAFHERIRAGPEFSSLQDIPHNVRICWSYLWKRRKCRGEESWENGCAGVRVPTEIPARMLCTSVIYMKCLFNSFSVLTLKKERVVFSQRLSFLLRALACCSGWLKLSEQSLLVCAPYPGVRPYPHCPLLAHCWSGRRRLCWRVVQSHLRERWTCQTGF